MKKLNKLRTELIKSKISNITDCLEAIEENLPQSFDEFKEMGIAKDGIYKKIEFAIQNIIDICSILNSDLNLGIPENEDSIINSIENSKIFEKKITDLIREMKGFRNILVHKYGKINDEQAFETIKEGLKDFELIIKNIEEFLKK